MRWFLVLLCSFGGGLSLGYADDLALPPGIENTQDPSDVPPSPEEALRKITVPEGFQTTLFAGEPYVRQPVAFDLDDRGRLWVVEFYSYRNWQPEGNDRIVILEDTTGDGQFNERTVFWDEGNYLTGIALGFGGVFICNAPHLSFIPIRDGEDVPDGDPVVLLDGWSTTGVHNVVNGLTWGPDGWLYGCNGITSPSKVGKPGTPEDERVDINCGIWRYHPVREEFEVVAHGTTNPWGLDFDEHGHAFFTNCVIGHLWHLVPGARYKRMFGQDFNPHTYELMDQCADHLHWTGPDWADSGGGQPEQLELGGGHAHCGAMIYLGDNWPPSYRGAIFTANVHGNRVNMDRLERYGSGFVGRHEPDFMLANDPWFRGVELKYGPDGGVYVTDWTDYGECHDADGIHQDSGRIYKITYGEAQRQGPADLATLDDVALVELHDHENEYFVRHARRLLHERAADGQVEGEAVERLHQKFKQSEADRDKLRAMWTLHVLGQLDEAFLRDQLAHESEHVRVWAIRLLCEPRDLSRQALSQLVELAQGEASPLVRLELASILQRLPYEDRWEIAYPLVQHEQDQQDAKLPLMIWYGIEPAVADDPARAVQMLGECRIPKVREFLARRIASL